MTTSNKTTNPSKAPTRSTPVADKKPATQANVGKVENREVEEPVKYIPSRRVWPD